MKRTPMELAALASAAVPGLAPTGVSGAPDDPADFDSALLIDDAGKQWRVRAPRHAEASIRLETELQVLRAFPPSVRAELPFLIPHVAGTVRIGDLRTFVYSHIEGSTRSLDGLAASGPGLAAEIGRTIAAIHELPRALVDQADLPSYEANEVRQRRLNELDQAATTGRIPADLLRRWEHALEDVTLWRFNPTVVHGDMHEDNLLLSAGRVCAVTGWTDLTVGDPADDFAWLAAAHDVGFADAVTTAYREARTDTSDEHLLRRASLAAEFALAQWMVRGIALGDDSMMDEAEEMMRSLSADLAAEEALARDEADAYGHDDDGDTVAFPDPEDSNASEQGSSDDDDRDVADARTVRRATDDRSSDDRGSEDGGSGKESMGVDEAEPRLGRPHHYDNTETSALPVVRLS